MTPWRRSVGSVVCALGLLELGAPRAAHADDLKTECASAYEQSQVQRAAGRLIAARVTLALCLQSECPAFIQAECGEWRAEVERAMPTVVVAARNANGADAISVRVLVDGETITDKLDGKEIAIDPGQHRFRFETAGAEPVEQNLLVRQGEKNRVIDVHFASGAPPPETEPALPADEGGPGPLRPYAFVAGGVGAVGVAGWAVLGLLAKGREHHLADTCSPTCSSSDVDGLRSRYAVANVLLGIGLVGLASGAALFFLSEPERPSSGEAHLLDLRVRATKGGAVTTVSGDF